MNEPSSELFLMILATVGTLFTIYFGYFRYKHFLWARNKVQYDVFVRINQHNTNYFLKVATLVRIRKKNPKLATKGAAVLLKYANQCQEKFLLIQEQAVNKKMALFWIEQMKEEWSTLAEIDQTALDELVLQLSKQTSPELMEWLIPLDKLSKNEQDVQPPNEKVYHWIVNS